MKGKHRGGFASRFGAVPEEIKKSLSGKTVIWIHAVSVGEIALAVRLADSLREKLSRTKFVLTTTTAAGKEVGEKIKDEDDAILYFPVDFRRSVRRFVRDVTPRAVIILETEIWPNLIYELSDRKIPVFILNARISDKAIGKYRGFKFFLEPVLNRLTAIGAQDEGMRSRFLELGARAEQVRVTGNLKFDWLPSARHEETAKSLGHALRTRDSLLCVAGSTHEGEEEILFKLYAAVKKRHPDFRLLIAPRHLERLAAVEAGAARNGVRVKRVSSLEKNGYDGREADAVILLDRMGALASFYETADIVLVGGSLVNLGGHNPVEPAFFEKAILFGPFMNNFLEMAEEFKKNGAAVQVSGPEELEKELEKLIASPEKRRALGAAAKDLVLRHQGATEKNMNLLLTSLGET